MEYLILIKWILYALYSSTVAEAFSHRSIGRPRRVLNSSPDSEHFLSHLYSPWSAWSECSTTCGIGISTRTRTCLTSTNGEFGHLCKDELEDHKICNTKICSSILSPREEQCSQYNGRVVAGKYVKKWKPAGGVPNPCELRCEAIDIQLLVHGFGKVSDGTPCPDGLCVDGRCLKSGCDEKLGSDRNIDMCGICRGRNSSCVHRKSIYQGQQTAGSSITYYEAAVIPSGARNLLITQALGKNIIALQDRNKGIIFNREQGIYGTNFSISGSQVQFKKNGKSDELLVKGPISQDLHILVLLRAFNPGIYYEYWLPKQQKGSKTIISNDPYFKTHRNPHKKTSQSQLQPIPVHQHLPEHNKIRHFPNKPLFAYGFGDTPYNITDLPVLRAIRSTTLAPSEDLPHSDESTEHPIKQKPLFTRLKQPIFRHRGIKAPVDFYQTYRGVTTTPKPAESTSSAEYPIQGDSTNTNEETALDSILDNLPQNESPGNGSDSSILSVSNDTITDSSNASTSGDFDNSTESIASRNSSASSDGEASGVSTVSDVFKSKADKRADNFKRSHVSNGRFQYYFETKQNASGYVNNSITDISPFRVNVLTLPDGSKNDKEGSCKPCPRNKGQAKYFCASDFVIRATLLSYEFLHGETRYLLQVLESFKNTLSLDPKEFIWSPDTCRCPKLRPGKEYILMGRVDPGFKRTESRLLVDRTSFVRTANLKNIKRLLRLRSDSGKKCKAIS